jgi:hypothetical protein
VSVWNEAEIFKKKPFYLGEDGKEMYTNEKNEFTFTPQFDLK